MHEGFCASELRISRSPNCEPRADGRSPDMIVLHYTAMDSAEAARARMCDLETKVSAHYLIGLDGEMWGLVDERLRAWHAGLSSWRGDQDVNSRSIGIELDHPGPRMICGACVAAPFTEAQMSRLEALLRALIVRWSIEPAAIVAHSDIAPERKIDPGEKFDWTRLARQGLAMASTVEDLRAATTAGRAHADPDIFAAETRRLGYGPWRPEAVLAAFRRRFRAAAVNAPFGAIDVALARRLADRLPLKLRG